jgi:hypothetical protein
VYAKEYDDTRKKWDPKAFRGRFVGFDPASPKCFKVWKPATHCFINTSNIVFDENIQPSETATGVSELDKFFLTPIGQSPDVHMPLKESPQPTSDPGVYTRTRSSPQSHSAMIAETMCKSQAVRNVPVSIKKAKESSDAQHWQSAIDSEVKSLADNDTMEVQMRRSGVRVLGLKWVFKIKEAIDGTIARWKARCTVLGNLQREGFDYEETFSPVVRYDTLRYLLAVATSRSYHVHQMDVDTAFLYGSMADEPDIYIELPEGYPIPEELRNVDRSRLMGKLNKALYGLKQSPRLWNKNFHNTMLSKGFVRTKADSCLYVKSSGGEKLFVAVFVDDLVIAGSSLTIINSFKEDLESTYNMKDLGELKYCLGIEIDRNANGQVKLFQGKYIDDIMKRFGLEKAHTEPIPMVHGLKLSKSMSPKTPEEAAKAAKFPYREIVGSLMYLMISTRPDISYAVGQLAMYLNCHGPEHHAAALYLLRYVKGTRNLGITYSPNTSLEVVGYSDSDWAANIDTKRSTTGYIFYAAGGPISWKSKVQATVALSSTETEYMALTSSAQEATSLRKLQKAFKISIASPVLINEDNQGAIAISTNPVMHSTSKHISIKQHFIREKVQDGDVRLEYVSTENMLADALTKALSKVIFLRLRSKVLGM